MLTYMLITTFLMIANQFILRKVYLVDKRIFKETKDNNQTILFEFYQDGKIFTDIKSIIFTFTLLLLIWPIYIPIMCILWFIQNKGKDVLKFIDGILGETTTQETKK